MRARLLISGLSLLIAGGATAADSDDAFLIDKRTFKKQVRTIALVGIGLAGLAGLGRKKFRN